MTAPLGYKVEIAGSELLAVNREIAGNNINLLVVVMDMGGTHCAGFRLEQNRLTPLLEIAVQDFEA